MKLNGTQSEQRTISALPIRIDYQQMNHRHRRWPASPAAADKLADVLFVRAIDENNGFVRPIHENVRSNEGFHSYDPYAIRDAFENVTDPDSAQKFLDISGIFWNSPGVYWNQFREWQRFFHLLRQEPNAAMQTPEGRQALITSHGFDLAFFTERPVFSEALRKPLSAEKMEQAAKVHRGLLAHHCRFVLHPASLQVSIQWRFADDDTFALQLPHSSYGETPRSPFLLIDATNVLEAVAATIYADRVHNIVNDKCKHCGKLFPVQSGHGQQFCPPNAATSTSSCKNAYLQKQLRTRDSLAVDFLLSRRTQGMTKAQSIKAATSQMIHVSKRALTRADEKWAKPNRVKTAAQAHSKKPVTSG